MSQSIKLAMFLGLSVSACSTVPKDAPQEFADAQSSLDTMDNNKVKKTLPNTSQRAHSRFKDAVADLKTARKEKEPETTAIQKARETKEIADSGTEVTNNVRSWDEDQEKLSAALRDMKTPRTAANSNTETPFAKLRDKDIVTTVAYFKTADATAPILNKKHMDSLTSVLKSDKSFHVVLTGHADKRGDETFNENLAMERAKTIATALQNEGIDQSQIVFRSAGATEAMGENRDVMQLDRNVEAVVNLR